MTTSLWLEDKYVNLLGVQLERFARKDSFTYNFRCPLCGDSQKNRFKSRGYIYRSKDHLNFRCHNCGRGMSARSFIKEIDPHLHDEMRLESLKESGKAPTKFPPAKAEPKAPIVTDPLSALKPISYFGDNHPVRKYIEDRKIPYDQVSRFLYCNRFMEWVNTVVPGKFTESQLKMDEPRLVIPFADAEGRVFAVTGRSFKKQSIKYITIKFDDVDKIYGLDRVDPSKRVYIFEGPIDSMFVENSIAFAGSSGAIPRFDDSVIVLDNEPRNKEIVRLNEKFIEAGHTVCIWPKSFVWKDVNESIVDGQTSDDVKKMIDENSFRGLAAKVRFNEWKAA